MDDGRTAEAIPTSLKMPNLPVIFSPTPKKQPVFVSIEKSIASTKANSKELTPFQKTIFKKYAPDLKSFKELQNGFEKSKI